MCSGSETGSYLKLIDFVHHSTLGLRVMKKKRRRFRVEHRERACEREGERERESKRERERERERARERVPRQAMWLSPNARIWLSVWGLGDRA